MELGDLFDMSAGATLQQRSEYDGKTGEAQPAYKTTGRCLHSLSLSAIYLRLGELYTRGQDLLYSGERPVSARSSPKDTTRSAQ